jgi:hypothetical protein
VRNSQKPKTVLGLFLGGGRLTFALTRQEGAAPVVAKQGSEAFALAPGQDDPDVIAEKLREILARQRIKVRHCVLALPLSWVVSSRFAAGEIAADALPGVAALELERLCGAPVSAKQLVCFPADDAGQALAATVEPGVARHLTEAFRRAGLSLGCFVPAAAAARPDPDPGIVADILPLPDGVDAVIRCDGRPVALRQLALYRDNSAQRMAECLETTMRSLQVTLSALRTGGERPVSIRVLGSGHCVDELCRGLGERTDWSLRELPDSARPPAEQAAIMASCADWGDPGALALPVPPRERRSHWWNTRSARPLVLAASIAVLAIVAFVVAFVARRLEVRRLEARLAALRPQQEEAEGLRDELRLTAPWYSRTPEQLEVLRTVTEAFPDQGTVWVTELSVETDGKVTLTGCARNQSSWLLVSGELQKRTQGLRVLRTRQGTKPGEPMTFSVTFSMPHAGRTGRA